MELKQGTLLQGGKYRIDKVLGQGGFGITYLATDTRLDRKICIKEFFMKEYCSRDGNTSVVTIASEGAYDMVEKCRAKFIKEARIISSMRNSHIITIFDVFEENGSAYYTMEFMEGGSLKSLVEQKGALSEATALKYVADIADALSCMHKRMIVHLDVKPSNIMLDSKGNTVLIDFGISKQYDYEGSQTSNTPVGISKGYAPMEQYNQGGVSTFSPETDIYSLGATLYFLLVGNSPKEATIINEEGIGEMPKNISRKVKKVIKHAMQPKRKDRFSNVDDFLKELPIQDVMSSRAKNDMSQKREMGNCIGFKPNTILDYLLWATYPFLWAVQHKMNGCNFKYWHAYANPYSWMVIYSVVLSMIDDKTKEYLQPISWLFLLLIPIGAITITIMMKKETRRLASTELHFIVNIVALVLTLTFYNLITNVLYNILLPLIMACFYIKDKALSHKVYLNAFICVSIANTILVTIVNLLVSWLFVLIFILGIDS